MKYARIGLAGAAVVAAVVASACHSGPQVSDVVPCPSGSSPATWRTVAGVTDRDLGYVAGSAADNVWIEAPGDFYQSTTGALMRFDGQTWTTAPLPWTPGALLDGDDGPLTAQATEGLAVIAPDDVWIGIASDPSPALHWDGAGWTEYNIGDNRHVGAFWASGPNDVWGAEPEFSGGASYLGHFDGQQWVHTGPNIAPNAIWGAAPDDVWGVGLEIDHWTHIASSSIGADVATVASPTSSELLSISGASTAEIWAVGRGGAIIRFDGSNWRSVSTPTTHDLWGVFCACSGRCWAVGDAGTVLRLDGGAWTAESAPSTADLRGVWGSSPTDLWAVGSGGTVLHASP